MPHQLLCPPGEVAGRAGTNSDQQLSGRRRPDGELSAPGRAWDTQATVGIGPHVGTVQHVSCSASVERDVAQDHSFLARQSAQGFSPVELALGVEGCGRKSVVGLVVKRWLAQLEGRDESASETRQQRDGGADAEGLGWLSKA
ncbi:hypothetical protein CYMTET_52716 [Cymbomonas tetramitiformis]|uniref:Uncharacterized protein n=1 Tax=Cymbomonas tetramitiformis TaxID=36881 RepID=A0AAE0EQI5_9CHLO|nr:hypothetical protein CYMTET_52716 [Cymbomonas tetramitiformis]